MMQQIIDKLRGSNHQLNQNEALWLIQWIKDAQDVISEVDAALEHYYTDHNSTYHDIGATIHTNLDRKVVAELMEDAQEITNG